MMQKIDEKSFVTLIQLDCICLVKWNYQASNNLGCLYILEKGMHFQIKSLKKGHDVHIYAVCIFCLKVPPVFLYLEE